VILAQRPQIHSPLIIGPDVPRYQPGLHLLGPNAEVGATSPGS
jgi:hypothetical protein